MLCRKVFGLFLSLILVAGVSYPQEGMVRFVYFNDAHELDVVLTDIGDIGGVSRMKTVIDSIKQVDPHAIVLFGGDLGGGTLGGKLYRGSVMVQALNQFPVDYANFGQHDFDYGLENTNKLVGASSFKWFSSNIVTTEGNRIENTLPFVRLEKQGVRVGIIGLTDKMNTTRPGVNVRQQDLFESVEHAVKEMGDVDMLMAVTQMDMKLNEQLVRRFPGIKVVFTEETSQHRSEVQYVGGSVIIAGCGNIGRLDEVVWNGGQVAHISSHPIDQYVVPDPKLEAFVRNKEQESAKLLGELIGHVDTLYYGSKAATGRLVADAFRDYYKTDLSLMHGGGLRSTFDSPNITKRDIYSVLPFGNTVVPVQLSGAQIAELVRVAYSMDGGFSVSGAEVVVTKERGVKLIYKGSELLPNQIYTISIPDFIASGGGDFEPITARRIFEDSRLRTDDYIVTAYVRKVSQEK